MARKPEEKNIFPAFGYAFKLVIIFERIENTMKTLVRLIFLVFFAGTLVLRPSEKLFETAWAESLPTDHSMPRFSCHQPEVACFLNKETGSQQVFNERDSFQFSRVISSPDPKTVAFSFIVSKQATQPSALTEAVPLFIRGQALLC